MHAKGAVLAAAAAALFTAGVSAPDTARADQHEVHCEGVNACKGKSDCGVKGINECAGQNACKGKGWKTMTAEECEKAKEQMKDA